jgi:hypothetical protein
MTEGTIQSLRNEDIRTLNNRYYTVSIFINEAGQEEAFAATPVRSDCIDICSWMRVRGYTVIVTKEPLEQPNDTDPFGRPRFFYKVNGTKAVS